MGDTLKIKYYILFLQCYSEIIYFLTEITDTVQSISQIYVNKCHALAFNIEKSKRERTHFIHVNDKTDFLNKKSIATILVI